MLDPTQPMAIEDFSADTIHQIIEQLEVSTEFEHLIARESELDAVHRLIYLAIDNRWQSLSEQMEAHLHSLLRAVREAHDLIAQGEAADSAQRLRQALHSSL